ncbi:MAG TPA: hypothetical protein VJ970_01770, partial [Flavobacteriaceae bacterium]|nr:hypothetical protein [Flavobacteriaceae bacterium]
LKKAQNKTIVFAMHHPMYTNGTHGGFYGVDKDLYPLQKKIPMPGLASLVKQVRAQGGVSIQDRYNELYNSLMNRLETLMIGAENLIIVSGHEHSLQYIEDEYLKQIVSGSAAKASSAALNNNGTFSYGGKGFAEFIVYEDGSSWVRYYKYDNGKAKALFQKEVHPPRETYDISHLPEAFPETIKTSIYTEEETDKTDFFESVWGQHYREMYSKQINAKVVDLDTLYGGLEVVRKGGGHQTRSLRLQDKEGRDYNMRALRKSATQYLQAVVFKDKYIQDDFERTFVEELILDFYTAAHPYAFLTIPDLSKAINIYHPKPKLFYVPKQKALGRYNEEYGDELYMIEERPEDDYTEERTFGYADDIESTYDIIEKVRKDEKYKIDEPEFIKARLFDMLIGDWDRHQDQWRWAQFDQPNGDKLYRPIPRDRDQVFSNFDGTLLDVMRLISSSTNQLQVYDKDLKDIEWMNKAGVKLDRVLIQQADKDDWIKAAEFIQNNITDSVINVAFSKVPPEAQDETLADIKRKLIGRRGNLVDIAERYYNHITSLVILHGTDKDDFIEVLREGKNKTRVIISRNIDDKKGEVMVDRVFDRDLTKEIWIYGLDDKDQFFVSGKANNPITIRIIGGQENDSYTITNGRAIKVYDHKSKPNTIVKNKGAKIKFKDIYDYNNFDYTKHNYKKGKFTPIIGYNPDDGFLAGISLSKTKYAFERNPFTKSRELRIGYYFATKGLDIRYDGEYNISGPWNLHVGGVYTTNNYTQNFFGYGNETENLEDDLGLDYNRVKTSIYGLKLGLLKKAPYGSDYGIRTIFEGIELDNTPNRFISEQVNTSNPDFFDRRYYGGLEGVLKYKSFDYALNPTRGMDFKFETGVKTELENTKYTFGYINSHMAFYNHLNRSRKLVLKSKVATQVRFGDDIEFYQAANIGGNTGLRGYRTHRFTGKNSLVGNADLRYSFDRFKTRTMPLQIGVFAGYDVGRVWIKNEDSNKWHTSYGGGLWVTAAESVLAKFNLFTGDDGLRFSFGFGLDF